MRRSTFDKLMTAGGLVITIALVVAGVLGFVGYKFANDNVTTQLAEQKIFFPKAGSDALKDPRIGPYLNEYAGQQLTTGAQAEAYANHYIKVHIADTGKGTDYAGKTYAELGGVQAALRTQIAATQAKDPGVGALETKLADVTKARETVFKGESLRGLLLNAYAWWKIGQIALWATLGAFAAAIVLAALTILGFVHSRRVSPAEEMFTPMIAKAS